MGLRLFENVQEFLVGTVIRQENERPGLKTTLIPQEVLTELQKKN